MPRKMSKNAPAKIAAMLKRREAAELRASGYCFEEIAEKLGVSETRVRQLLDEFVASSKCENIDLQKHITEQQLSDLRLLKSTWFPAAMNVNNGPKTLTAFLKLLTEERTAAGITQPIKLDAQLTGANGGAIESTINFSNATTEQLLMLQQLLSEINKPKHG